MVVYGPRFEDQAELQCIFGLGSFRYMDCLAAYVIVAD